MSASPRHYSLFDRMIGQFDQSLRTLTNSTNISQRPNPAASIPETTMTETERKHSAGLIRVDHTGEVCAQALYQAQALTANSAEVRLKMQQSATEETDHLVWCQQRLQELNSHTSYLNPMWYFGSFLLGAIAGLVGDRWSLGFVAETEHQVVKHLENHLQRLPSSDQKSEKILQQMREDEAQHATLAITTGAAELPAGIKTLMQWMSKVMTTTAYWV